jgi:hypothetical protein
VSSSRSFKSGPVEGTPRCGVQILRVKIWPPQARGCWSAIVTRRGERIRILSVRRSRREEVSWYESEGS